MWARTLIELFITAKSVSVEDRAWDFLFCQLTDVIYQDYSSTHVSFKWQFLFFLNEANCNKIEIDLYYNFYFMWWYNNPVKERNADILFLFYEYKIASRKVKLIILDLTLWMKVTGSFRSNLPYLIAHEKKDDTSEH